MAERRGHVLVVDDEPDIRSLVTEILGDEGYEVVAAGRRGGRPRAAPGAPAGRDPAGHLDARHGRDHPAPGMVRRERCRRAGHRDVGSRHHRDRGRGDPARGLRFSRETDLPRQARADRGAGPRGGPPHPRERAPAPPDGDRDGPHRRQQRDERSAGTGGPRGGPRRPHPRDRRVRRRQIAPRPPRARAEPPAGRPLRRRAGRRVDRAGGAVRLRARLRHPLRPSRARQRRHRVPRGRRGHAPGDAGEPRGRPAERLVPPHRGGASR